MRFLSVLLSIGLMLGALPALAQQDQAKDFEEANRLMQEELWNVALPIWKKMLVIDPENSNYNYKAGLCYFNQPNKRNLAIPHFEMAVGNVKVNYDPFAFNEKAAPVEAYYYYARVLHLGYQITKAQEFFTKFQNEASKKHYLQEDVVRQLEKCANALELMGNPLNVEMYNLGEKVNSEYPDYSPVISLDENAIFFTSRRLRKDSSNMVFKDVADGMYFEDIYVSYKDEEDEWMEPELLNINIRNRHLATVNLQNDVNKLFIYRDDDGDGNLYLTTYKDSMWTYPTEFGKDVNSKYYETHVTVSPDGQTMFFTSDRKGGLGGKDIYRSVKLPNGTWSMAKNVGAPINTPFDEDGPFFHSDGRTLYFASTAHKGMGGYDIFKSVLDPRTDTWSEPENIGYPINTPDNDVFFVVTPDGKRAYYSSASIHGGYGEKDIYMIERIDAEETPLTLLKGFIVTTDESEVPASTIITVTDNATGDYIAEATPQPRNGSFVFIIPPGKNYNVSYSVNGKTFFSEDVFVPEGSSYTEINKEILLNTVGLEEGGDVVVVSAGDKKKQSYKFHNLPADASKLKVMYVEPDGTIVFTEKVKKDGFFRYHELPPNTKPIFELDADDPSLCGSDMQIVLLSDKSDPNSVVLTLYPDPRNPCRFKEKELEPVYFEHYFKYNQAKLTKESPQFVEFIDKVMMILHERGSLNIAFESSASHVPTETFKTNDLLTEARAEKAKNMVFESVAARGGDVSKLEITNYTTLVQGPKYNNDFDTNRDEYEKYQYIKISAR